MHKVDVILFCSRPYDLQHIKNVYYCDTVTQLDSDIF